MPKTEKDGVDQEIERDTDELTEDADEKRDIDEEIEELEDKLETEQIKKRVKDTVREEMRRREREEEESEERKKSPRARQRRLPTEKDLSTKQISATESIRNMNIEDLMPCLGVNPYTDWEIRVIRRGPELYEGKKVESRRIERFRNLGIKYGDFLDRIESVHGGGTYCAQVYDDNGVSRKQKTFEIDGQPKWDPNIYPDFAEMQADGGERSMSAEEQDLVKEIKVTRLKKELKSLKEGSGDNRGGSDVELARVMTDMFTTQMGTTESRLADMQRREEERERRMEERERRAEERIERILQVMAEKKPDEDSATKSMVEMMKSSTESLVAVMSQNQQSQIEAMKMQMQSERKNNEMMMEILRDRSSNGDSSIDILRLMNESKIHSSEMSMELLKIMVPILTDKDNAEDDPRIRLIEAISQGVDQVADLGKMAMQLKGARPGLPGSKAGPRQPKAQAQGQDEKTQQEQPADAANVYEHFKSLDDSGRMDLIFGYVRMEAKDTPDPSESFFVNLVLTPECPEMLTDFIANIKDARDLREQLFPVIPEDHRTIYDAEIFASPERVQWLDSCISYIHQEFAKPEEPEEEPQVRKQPETGDADGQQEHVEKPEPQEPEKKEEAQKPAEKKEKRKGKKKKAAAKKKKEDKK